ncbi:MAG: hypothetical protein FJX31_00180 [Alphaproteobacteria bacterium]|nr:hypothetical protein [Alphaproteobacteria bacterium]
MKRAALALALIAALFAAGPGEARKPEFGNAANPSALIATEIAFNRRAQEKGQWTAFREFAAKDAMMFVPQPVNAQTWLKGRANPPQSVVWQPHQVWMSCDGSLGATRGAWQRPDGSTGYFTTIWRRQKKGDYKWVMDEGDALAAPLEAPELIAARIAGCRSRPGDWPAPQWTDGEIRGGEATDGTLFWQVRVRPDGRRHLSVGLWDGSQWQAAVSTEAGP